MTSLDALSLPSLDCSYSSLTTISDDLECDLDLDLEFLGDGDLDLEALRGEDMLLLLRDFERLLRFWGEVFVEFDAFESISGGLRGELE